MSKKKKIIYVKDVVIKQQANLMFCNRFPFDKIIYINDSRVFVITRSFEFVLLLMLW